MSNSRTIRRSIQAYMNTLGSRHGKRRLLGVCSYEVFENGLTQRQRRMRSLTGAQKEALFRREHTVMGRLRSMFGMVGSTS